VVAALWGHCAAITKSGVSVVRARTLQYKSGSQFGGVSNERLHHYKSGSSVCGSTTPLLVCMAGFTEKQNIHKLKSQLLEEMNFGKQFQVGA
jgi:hypothetical protein